MLRLGKMVQNNSWGTWWNQSPSPHHFVFGGGWELTWYGVLIVLWNRMSGHLFFNFLLKYAGFKMLISALQQGDLVIQTHTHVYIHIFFSMFFSIIVYQRILNIVLCYTVGPCSLPILHINADIC